jgi:hypothetical protein
VNRNVRDNELYWSLLPKVGVEPTPTCGDRILSVVRALSANLVSQPTFDVISCCCLSLHTRVILHRVATVLYGMVLHGGTYEAPDLPARRPDEMSNVHPIASMPCLINTTASRRPHGLGRATGSLADFEAAGGCSRGLSRSLNELRSQQLICCQACRNQPAASVIGSNVYEYQGRSHAWFHSEAGALVRTASRTPASLKNVFKDSHFSPATRQLRQPFRLLVIAVPDRKR